MSIFKRKNTLRKRIQSVEDYFGLFWSQDSYGDFEHKLEHDGYSTLIRLVKDVDELKKKGKK
jgi:hypothetical protein